MATPVRPVQAYNTPATYASPAAQQAYSTPVGTQQVTQQTYTAPAAQSNYQTSYVPSASTQSYGAGQNFTMPTGQPPQPLPTSHNYVRPVKVKQTGIKNKLRDAMSRTTSRATRTWNESTDERFRRYFGFNFSEQLFGEWWGDVWSGGQLMSASSYISTNYLCILYKRKDAVTKDKIHIKATIALRDITFLQPAVCLKAAAGGTPVIQPITDATIRADSIIIYTCDGKMHQICNFHNYETFMHTLNWNWRTIKAGGQPSNIPASIGQQNTAMPGSINYGVPQVLHQEQQAVGMATAPATGQPLLVKQTTATNTVLPSTAGAPTGTGVPPTTQQYGQPGLAQPGLAQPGYAQSGVAQPGVAQPGGAQSGVAPGTYHP